MGVNFQFVMKSIFSILLLFGLTNFANSQDSNRVNYEQLGISFVIPAGWQGQEINEGILLQHTSIQGIIFIATHNYTKEQLTQEAKNGLNDGQGTSLKLIGNLSNLSNSAIGGDYEGLLEGNDARAFIIGVENPFGGLGVTIIAASTRENFTNQMKEAGLELFGSFEFKKVEASENLAEWKTWLAGKNLKYFESYSSPSSYEGGISGGYSINRSIDLCPNGYFVFGNRNSFQMDGLGSNLDKTKGSGTWDIITGNDGTPTLKLLYYNGEESFYRLEYANDKLYLNGDRYFRTEGNEIQGFCQ